jgi:hypothetical protein
MNNMELQALIDAGKPIPKTTHTIDPVKGLLAKGKLDLTGVILRASATDKGFYSMLVVAQPDVVIKGGTLIGDRDIHKGTADQHGYGIHVKPGAKNVTIQGTTCSKMWGDGFFVSGGSGITFRNVIADANRRQGMSICHGGNIQVLASTFKNTRGTPPQAGIDVEPWVSTQLVTGVVIDGCSILNNAGHGITINHTYGPVRNLKVQNCTFSGNGKRALNYWGWSKVYDFMVSVGLARPTSIVIP